MSDDDEKQSGNRSSSSRTGLHVRVDVPSLTKPAGNVLMYLIGDSTWAAIPEYDDVQARSSSTLAAEPWNVMVCTLSVKGQALQQNEDIKRKKLGGVVEDCAASCAALTVGGVGGAAAGAQFGNAFNAPSVKSNGQKD